MFLESGEHSIIIGSAIDKYVTIALKELSNIFDFKLRLSYSIIECIKDIEELEHKAVKHIFKKYDINKHLDIHIITDLPKTGGTGSSSSFITCLIATLNTLNKVHWSKKKIAQEAINIERNEMGLEGGFQDQIFAAYGGGLSKIEFINNDFSVEPIITNKEFMEELQNHIILFHTDQNRLSGEVTKSYTSISMGSLTAIRDIALESLKHFSEGNLEQIGGLLNLSWKNKRNISDKISNQYLDDIINCGLNNGAIGSKIIGAGSGGHVLFLCPPEKQEGLCSKLSGLKPVRCRFDYQGTTVIFDE